MGTYFAFRGSRTDPGFGPRLEGLSYGRLHVLDRRTLLQRATAGVPLLQHFIRQADVLTIPTTEEALVVWASAPRISPTGPSLPWETASAFDAHGCRFNADWSRDVSLTGARTVMANQLSLFPRRDRDFRLRLYAGEGAVAGNLTVRNPKPGPFPTWTPEPVPATHLHGALGLTLANLHAWQAVRDSGGLDAQMLPVQASFRFTEHGRPTDRWHVARLQLGDAAGNQTFTTAYQPWTHGIGLPIDGLCSHEAAWKVTGSFFRTDAAAFTPAETLWNSIVVSLAPKQRVYVFPKGEGAWPRLVVFAALAGPGKVEFDANAVVRAIRPPHPPPSLWMQQRLVDRYSESQSGVIVGTPRPFFLARVPWTEPGRLLTLQAEDAYGRRIALPNAGQPDQQIAGTYVWELPVGSDVRGTRFHLALQEPVREEWIVKPPQPEPAPQPFEQLRAKNFVGAIAGYRRLLEVTPDDSLVANGLAWTYLVAPPRYRNPSAALTLARAAVRIAPGEVGFANTLAVALYRTGRWAEALEVLRHNASQPGVHTAYDRYCAAMAHFHLGHRAAARRELQSARQWRAHHPPPSPSVDEELRAFDTEASSLFDLPRKGHGARAKGG